MWVTRQPIVYASSASSPRLDVTMAAIHCLVTGWLIANFGWGRTLLTGRFVLLDKRRVDIEQNLPLALRDRHVGDNGVEHLAGLAWLENPGPHLKNLGGNTQRFRDLAQNVSGRLAQTAFDLAQIWIADTGSFGKLANRHLCRLALAPDEAADVGSCGGHLGGEFLLGCHCLLLGRLRRLFDTHQTIKNVLAFASTLL